MIDLEYRNAYSEVLEILKYISKEDFNKIPNELIKLFKENANKNYVFTYNPDKTLQEQNASKATKYIIAILFRDYWATSTQRDKILAKEKFDKNKMEEERRKLYNPDNIFQNSNNRFESNENIDNMQSLVQYEKETFLDKIKRIFSEITKKYRNK